MMIKLLSGSAAAMLSATVMFAAPAQQPSADQKPAAAPVTVVGCVQKEADVLKRTPLTGAAGMGDEFVLTHAMLKPDAASADRPAQPEPAPVGTSGTDPGTVYRVTGDKEKDLKDYIGQRVEITGAFKQNTDAKSEMGSIGTSGKPGELNPANTAEISIESFRATSGSCAGGGL